MKCDICKKRRQKPSDIKGICQRCRIELGLDGRNGARGKTPRKQDRYYMPYEWREQLAAERQEEVA